jgi:myosin-18
VAAVANGSFAKPSLTSPPPAPVSHNGSGRPAEDTVDRAVQQVLVRSVEPERKVGAGLPRKLTEEFMLNNNPPCNGLAGNVWGSRPAEPRADSSLDSESLASFSSSVTEDVELVLGGGRRGLSHEAGGREQMEEQLEELGQQVEQLMRGKARLEAEVAQARREQKRDVADREDELEDARNSAAKKVKLLELQLEQEHEERLGFLRERHEMEGRIMSLKDALDHGHNEEQVRKLRKDLRKSKALLKDAQLLLDKQGSEGMHKLVTRQLKNQLEDSEFARTAALKARQNCELDLAETQTQLEDVCRAKADLEERGVKVGRERADLALHLRENDEEMQELIKKYKASVAAGSTDQITIQDQAVTIQELEAQRNSAREKLAEAEQRVEHLKGESVSAGQHRRLELRLREMESKLELERTGRGRLETQVGRLKEQAERQTKEAEGLRAKEKAASEEGKKATRQWREVSVWCLVSGCLVSGVWCLVV